DEARLPGATTRRACSVTIRPAGQALAGGWRPCMAISVFVRHESQRRTTGAQVRWPQPRPDIRPARGRSTPAIGCSATETPPDDQHPEWRSPATGSSQVSDRQIVFQWDIMADMV